VGNGLHPLNTQWGISRNSAPLATTLHAGDIHCSAADPLSHPERSEL